MQLVVTVQVLDLSVQPAFLKNIIQSLSILF